jgi:hypothetical protein
VLVAILLAPAGALVALGVSRSLATAVKVGLAVEALMLLAAFLRGLLDGR